MTRQRAAPLAIAAVLCVGLIAGGLWDLNQQRTGEKTVAKVSGCDRNPGRYSSWVCRGTWVQGGSLLDGGHVEFGIIEGANNDQVGKRLDVRAHGGRAYVQSMRVPIILFIAGAIFGILGVVHLWRTHPR